jgi:hypothetical protein
MGRQRQKPQSFADLVHTARFIPQGKRPDAQPWPQPISDGHWTDEGGTRWHIRGGAGRPRPVPRRLLKRPELRILHAYGPHPTEVFGAEREALLERVERYFTGESPPHSEFWLAEFRDDDRNVMLVIEEAC